MFHGKRKNSFLYIMNSGSNIQNLQIKGDQRDLGNIFNQSLKCRKHFAIVSNKGNSLVYLITCSSIYMDDDIFCILLCHL